MKLLGRFIWVFVLIGAAGIAVESADRSLADQSAKRMPETKSVSDMLQPMSIEELFGQAASQGRDFHSFESSGNMEASALATQAGETTHHSGEGRNPGKALMDAGFYRHDGKEPTLVSEGKADNPQRILLASSENPKHLADPPDELPAETDKPEFLVDKSYLVTAKTYYYNTIIITNNGSLYFEDPQAQGGANGAGHTEFWAKSILVENGGTLLVGTPSKPIGTRHPDNTVTFHIYGTQSDPAVSCHQTNCGAPSWTDKPDKKSSLPGGVTDYFYKYQRLPSDELPAEDALSDTNYFGRKVLAVAYGGTVQMFGKKGVKSSTTGNSKRTSWVRLAGQVSAGENELILDRVVDWRPGDWIVVTSTDFLPAHSEHLQIDTVQGSKVTTRTALKYGHNGKKYDLTKHKIPLRVLSKLSPFIRNSVETRAAVGLLSRNIAIVSGGAERGKDFPPEPAPDDPKAPSLYFGAHTIVRQGFKSYQMQGVEFRQLGQGGRMAHNPINFHLTRKTPKDTFVKYCSIWDSMNHWIDLRGTQYVELVGNVGYRSIGHGYYLSDGAEAHNYIEENLGVYARPAVNYKDNPRQVPGILAKAKWDDFQYCPDPAKDTTGKNCDPSKGPVDFDFCINCADSPVSALLGYQGDYVHPSVFFIANGYNKLWNNMAVGAGTCGACYWIAPATIGGLSQAQTFEGYAGIQRSSPGAAPLQSFSGNFCSTAQYSLITVGDVGTCRGVNSPDFVFANRGKGEQNAFDPVVNPFSIGSNKADPYYGKYPNISTGANLLPMVCDEKKDPSCSKATEAPCIKGRTANCAVSVIDGYVSSFNWAQQNFAAIWLRNNWFLFTDSVLSDVLNGGLTMVSGGSWDQVINQYWAVTRDSIFIGRTQDPSDPKNNPYANIGITGPFSTGAQRLECDPDTAGAYCIVKSEGVNYPVDNFGVYQRLYNIYDGPVYQENNAYLDITKTLVKGENDRGELSDTRWLYGRAHGIPKAREGVIDPEESPKKGQCMLPNAAIGWKQPNGFFYPPAFHSRNLFFDNVDLRHYVIVPLFEPGTTNTVESLVTDRYCTYPPNPNPPNGSPKQLFASSFTDVDRQTELNDEDGTLSGLQGASPMQFPNADLDSTISVNTDSFFYAPKQTLECASEKTCIQSPYDYVTAVVFPESMTKEGENEKCVDKPYWGMDCENTGCYGVPIYRQYLRQGESRGKTQSIRMMGTGICQRNTLVANHGKYYIDTTVSEDAQRNSKDPEKDFIKVTETNVFEKNKKYEVFLLYPKENTEVTFQMYVGPNFKWNEQDESQNMVRMIRVGTEMDDGVVLTTPLEISPGQDWPRKWQKWPGEWKKNYNPSDGILEITINSQPFTDSDGLFDQFDQAKRESCGPPSFCSWNVAANSCGCAVDSQGKLLNPNCSNDVCKWSSKTPECPSGGCYGFEVQLSPDFNADDKDRRPATESFPAQWGAVKWKTTSQTTSGDDACYYQNDADVPDNVIDKAGDSLLKTLLK